jgi:hypothetical protein
MMLSIDVEELDDLKETAALLEKVLGLEPRKENDL